MSDELARRTGHRLRGNAADRSFEATGVNLADGMSADEAVAIALWNNGAFQADLAQLGIARADLADAGLLQNPVLSLLFPVGTKQLELAITMGLGWLWQRPSRVAAARFDAKKVAEQLVQHGLDLARDVRLAHAEVLLAEDLVALARDAAEVTTQLKAVADARLREGDVSQREVLAAGADARIAEVELEKARATAIISRAKLRALIGIGRDRELALSDSAPVFSPGELQPWMAIAVAARPDLRAAEMAVEAAGKRAGLERARMFDISGIFDVKESGRQIGPGIELPIPIFDVRQAGRLRARAELERTAWEYVEHRRTVEREISEAHARAAIASAALAILDNDVVPDRAEGLRLAELSYQRGEESRLVVLEASRSWIDARKQRAEQAAELRRATAELERAAGGRRAEAAK